MAVCGRDDPVLFDRALASVFENELKPDHVILVVDGPLPDTIEEPVAAAGAACAAELVRLPENRGLAGALNAALPHVGTEWIVRADADDYNLPQRFSRLAECIRSDPGLDLVGSAVLEIERDGTPVAVRQLPSRHDDIVRFAKRRNPFNHMTIACRRSLGAACGGYPEIHGREDYALWARMIRAGARCANLPETLVHATAGKGLYRRRGGMRSVAGERDLQRLLVQLGLKSPLLGLLDGVARSSVFVAPVFLRRLVYETLLRQPPPGRS